MVNEALNTSPQSLARDSGSGVRRLRASRFRQKKSTIDCCPTCGAKSEVLREITALREQIAKFLQSSKIADGWLDAKEAAKYLGISQGTFDKYRYTTSPRIEGAKLDGKTLYKKSDLDLFVKLYELKSQGLA